MVLNEKIKPFLVLILCFLTKKRLWFLNCAGSYKKYGCNYTISPKNIYIFCKLKKIKLL